MSLQLLSTFDSFSGAELHATYPGTVAQLSKVLRTAGIDAVRLAVMANLVETLAPSVTDPGKTRAVAALPKWRLMRVLAYIETNIGERITLANLAAAAGLSRMYFA